MFIPHMCYTSIIIQAFYIFRPLMKWTRELNLPNLAQNKQSIGKIIAKKKDASVIHKNEQQSQMEARANAEETGKRCLGTFAEKSRRTAEINKTRPS